MVGNAVKTEKEIYIQFLENCIETLQQPQNRSMGLCKCFFWLLPEKGQIEINLKIKTIHYLHKFNQLFPYKILDGISHRLSEIENSKKTTGFYLNLYMMNWFNRFDSGRENRLEFLNWVLKQEKDEN